MPQSLEKLEKVETQEEASEEAVEDSVAEEVLEVETQDLPMEINPADMVEKEITMMMTKIY